MSNGEKSTLEFLLDDFCRFSLVTLAWNKFELVKKTASRDSKKTLLRPEWDANK